MGASANDARNATRQNSTNACYQRQFSLQSCGIDPLGFTKSRSFQWSSTVCTAAIRGWQVHGAS